MLTYPLFKERSKMAKKEKSDFIPNSLNKLKMAAGAIGNAFNARKFIETEVVLHDERYLSGEWDLPDYATEGSAAIDIRAAITEPLTIHPGRVVMVKAGLAIHIGNPNYTGLLLPRSGLGSKKGIVLGNLTGLFDADFMGEMGIPLWNRNIDDLQSVTIEPGDRVAQFLIIPVVGIKMKVVKAFSVDTARGINGFGHSGVK